MAKAGTQKQIIPIEYIETFNPSSPYYIKPEDRENYQFASVQNGLEKVDPFLQDRVWVHPKTGQLVSIDEAKNYWRPVISPETGETAYQQLNPLLGEVEVPNWKEALKMELRPTGGGGMRPFWGHYKRKNNERYSYSPEDYNPEDDLGPIGQSPFEQSLEYIRQHPVSSAADNPLNWLLFDAITLGGTAVGRQAMRNGVRMLNNVGNTVVEGLSRATPSGLMEGISYYAPKAWSPMLKTIGSYGDAAAASYFLGNAINNIGQGLYNRNTQQIAQGGLDAMYGLPMFTSLKGMPTIVPEFNITLPSYGAIDKFIANPRTQAVLGGLGYGVLNAAASEPKPKFIQNEDGEWVQATDPETGELLYEDQNIFEKTWDLIKEHPLDAALIGYVAAKVGWNKYAKKPTEPIEYTVSKSDGTSIIKKKPQGERVPAPEYQPVDYIPDEAIPKELVRPTSPNVPYQEPTPGEYGAMAQPSVARPSKFSEKLISPPGERPISGKNLAKRQQKWDKQNQAYQEQQARKKAYEEQNAEAKILWDAYDSPEQVKARMKFEKAKADYDANGAEYARQWNQYDQEMQKYSSDYNTALAKYNTEQREAFPNSAPYKDWKTRDQLFEDYYGSKEYSKYNKDLESWKKRKVIPKNIWDWGKNHPLGVGLGAWWLGDKLFGGDNAASEKQTQKQDSTKQVDDFEDFPPINVDSARKVTNDSINHMVNYPNNSPELVNPLTYEDNNPQ